MSDEREPAPRLARAWRAATVSGAEALSTWLPLTVAIGLAPGAGLWALRHPHQLSHFANNALPKALRASLLTYSVASLAITLLVIGAALVAHRLREGRYSSEPARRLNRALAFFLAGPCVAVIASPGYSAEHPYHALVFAGIAALSCGVSAATLAPAITARGSELLRSRPWGALVVALAACAYAVRMSELVLTHHQNMSTGAYDLGIYTNVVWHTLQGDFLGCSFLRGGTHASAHFDPILALFAPLMHIHRGAETLLVAQAVWLASGALPVYLHGRHHVGEGFGVALGLVYLLFPALHSINVFDFHSLALSIPVVLWAVYFLEREAWLAYAIAVAVLLTVREDMAFQGICIGLYALAVKRAPRAGVATIAVAALYFVIVKRFFMTDPTLLMADSDKSYSFASFFSGLTPRDGSLLETVIANPYFVLQRVLLADRLKFALQLTLPLALLPLAAGRRWILLAFALTFLLLTSNAGGYSLAFHYSATALPGLFVLAAASAAALIGRLHGALGWEERRTRAGLTAAVLVAGVLSSFAFGALVPNDAFRAAWYRLEREPSREQRDRFAALSELKRRIGEDDSVCASGFVAPHFAARMELYHLPDCHDALWIVARGSRLPRHESGALRELRRDPRYELVEEREGLIALRRRPEGSVPAATPSRPTP